MTVLRQSKGGFSMEQLVILVVAVIAVLLLMTVMQGSIQEIFKNSIQAALN